MPLNLIDNLIAGQIDAQLRARITPANCRALILAAVDYLTENQYALAESLAKGLLALSGAGTQEGENVSFTKDQCKDFLAAGPHGVGATGVDDNAATTLQSALNDALNQGVGLGDIFAKIWQIYAIMSGPGTWLEKAVAVLALFGKAPGPNIVVPA